MEKLYIKNLQKRIVNLVRKYSKNPLHIAVKDSCSEISRIVGLWILQKYKNSTKIYVLKGKMRKNFYHDILLIANKGKFCLIDPTIWQINENKKTIFLGVFDHKKESLNFLKEKYGGLWKISENLKMNLKSKKKLMDIMKVNLTE